MNRSKHNSHKAQRGGPWILATLAILASTAQADGGGTYSVYDTDRDGYLDRQEFTPFAKSRERKGRPNNFWRFENVDRNGDERVSEQEMVNALIESLKARNK